MSISRNLEKYRQQAWSEKDKGDRFERIMQAYLLADPKFVHQFSKVWLWKEFPGRTDLGSHDTGIDLVALIKNDDYGAIQCKCYRENARIYKAAIDSFLSTSSRAFKNGGQQLPRFSHRLWIDTTVRSKTN